METIVVSSSINNQIVDETDVIQKASSSFIEANTIKVDLNHLKNDCIIPVFSKDNESTISHFQFISKAYEVVKELFPDFSPKEPEIRVSHEIKGRIPSAIGKPAKDLLEGEKTIYYERCAFLIELHQAKEVVNGNTLTLSVGGVRSYSQENLYSKKSVEKFKIFIGYQNKVCTNLCISTDGFSNEVRISSINELQTDMTNLFSNYDRIKHLGMMERMSKFLLNEEQFAHLVGKIRMYQHLDREEQKSKQQFLLNDGQINSVVKDYFTCPNFSRDKDKNISLWNLYNLFTEANKSSYIDNNLERNVNAYEFINYLVYSLQNEQPNWFLSL
ncbi:DUF3871 family protein [Flavobacterium sp. 102]|uniref:DUF3871 family protein n=1 Tax=Flavobacterium sp. 102 TaxID=2135623 RepID=UPI000EB10713|nr:DUF3871 family protein [Flavobacterium sp. 102]RKS01453.1 uncharacterized protein DUF3871 [Flavobacterium sp. 102]